MNKLTDPSHEFTKLSTIISDDIPKQNWAVILSLLIQTLKYRRKTRILYCNVVVHIVSACETFRKTMYDFLSFTPCDCRYFIKLETQYQKKHKLFLVRQQKTQTKLNLVIQHAKCSIK
ncbi:Hypothetical_protein [Hexamita inflata]|uniref:Hypothetical_protein n=1 Tax=Hexamita inflata TaxID=28002 RepID=A0AA86Q0X2_9EUKA|nr:Hypothetical protein HINF_LOCUS36206 [Hexamita inflata]